MPADQRFVSGDATAGKVADGLIEHFELFFVQGMRDVVCQSQLTRGIRARRVAFEDGGARRIKGWQVARGAVAFEDGEQQMAHHRIGFLQQFLYQLARNGNKDGVLDSAHGGGTGLLVDQCDLAKQFAFVDARALRAADTDLDAALLDQVGAVSGIAFLEDDLSGRINFLDADCSACCPLIKYTHANRVSQLRQYVPAAIWMSEKLSVF